MEAYLGNPNLKKINVPQEFSEENIIEYNNVLMTRYISFKTLLE